MKSIPVITGAFILCSLLPISSPLHAQYLENGSAVSTAPSGQWVESIATDGASGAVLVWEDWRGPSIDIYAQRIDAKGYPQWLDDGIVVCSADGQQQHTRIIPEGTAGSIIVWSDARSGSYVIYVQRIDADGNTVWTTDGVPLSTGDGWQQYPVPVTDGTGGAIVFWQAGIGSKANIYAQRIDETGVTQWETFGNAVCTAADLQGGIHAISDGSGGAIAVWNDRRSGNDDIYAQRINANGVTRWTADGVAVCAAAGSQNGGGIVADDTGGAIIVWLDYRNGTSWEVYAQRIDSLGTVQWTADGVYVPTRPGDAGDLCAAPDGAGGAYLAWIAAGALDSLFAGRIDGGGSPLWTSPLSSAGTVSVSNLVSDGSSGALIAWETNGDIYSQRIDADGMVRWPPGGVAVCTANEIQQFPVAAPDGAGGIIASWWDLRNSGGSAFEGDVYAGRVNVDGVIVATMLKTFSVFIENNTVVLRWSLSAIGEDAEFTVWRREIPFGDYTPVGEAAPVPGGLSFVFTDVDARPGSAYRYRVDVVEDGSRTNLFETDCITMPAAAVILRQNHPNPFNPSTTISYFIPDDARVVLEIFDVAGKPVTRLVDTQQKPGHYTVRWNGLDRAGEQVKTGVYLYRLTYGKHVISRKMVLVR